MPRALNPTPATLRRYELEDTLARLVRQRRGLDAELARYARLRRVDGLTFHGVRHLRDKRLAERGSVVTAIATVRAALAELGSS